MKYYAEKNSHSVIAKDGKTFAIASIENTQIIVDALNEFDKLSGAGCRKLVHAAAEVIMGFKTFHAPVEMHESLLKLQTALNAALSSEKKS